jgi:hypothetical protein
VNLSPSDLARLRHYCGYSDSAMASSFNPLTSAGDCGILEDVLLEKGWRIEIERADGYVCCLEPLPHLTANPGSSWGQSRSTALVHAALVVIP